MVKVQHGQNLLLTHDDESIIIYIVTSQVLQVFFDALKRFFV